MKKISILFLVLLSYLVGFGQAEQTRSSPTITVVDANAFEARSFRVPVYYDTIAANVVPQLDSAGKIIYTFSTNSLWFRANDPKKWVPISSTKGNNGGDTLFAQLPAFFDSTSRPGSTILKILRGNGVVTGGTVTVDSCRSLDIPPTTIILNYTEYTSIATRLTVPVGDGSNPRTDEVVDSLGTIVLKVGTPAATPIGAAINPATEWILASYTMPTGATCINVTQIIVWDENLGTTAEFNLTTSGTISANGNSLTNPFHLTKAIFVNTYADGGSLIFTYSSPLTAQASEIFKFWVYLNGAFGSNQFQVQFFNGSTPVGIPIAFNTGYGFNPNDSNQYQQVVIPFSAFNLTNQTFTKVVITFRGSDLSGAKGLYIDYVQLQTGNNIPNSQLVVTTNFTSGASTYDPFTNILNIPVYSGGGGSPTLQQVFDAQNAALLNKNDTINIKGNTLFFIDSQLGQLNYLLDSAGNTAHGKTTNYLQTAKTITMGTQDNTGSNSYLSNIILTSTKGTLSLSSTGPVGVSSTGQTIMNFYPDSLKVSDVAGNRLFKINQTTSQISFSQAYGDGAVYDFSPVYALGLDASGNVNAIQLPTQQIAFDNSVADADNPIIQLGGNNYSIYSGSDPLFQISPTSFISTLTATDETATSYFTVKGDLVGNDVFFDLDSYDGTNEVRVKGDAQANSVTYQAASHVFTGVIIMATSFTPANSTDNTYPNGALTQDDTFLYYRKTNGTWVKIPWVVF